MATLKLMPNWFLISCAKSFNFCVSKSFLLLSLIFEFNKFVILSSFVNFIFRLFVAITLLIESFLFLEISDSFFLDFNR